ncbi:hypothetical protein GGX14DRAFT_528867 [Mycena pura]|uniref:DUF6534 domain-containing protein n=1 Tax=Mycena pura TaxID=153505 RepID=A0AAD6UN70_9AGAR|nr:hypothetical protein GGX14DRAFT_528867 [Mycena pura]
MAVFSTQAPTLDNTLGALFLGVVISSILFGVSSLQVYYYYHYYPRDSVLHRISVGVLWILDALHLSLAIFSSYHYGVRGFGHLAGLLTIIGYVCRDVTADPTHTDALPVSLYAYRVWLLGGYHHGVLGYLVAGMVLAGFAIGIVVTVKTYSITSFLQTPAIAWAVEASLAASSTIDIILSGAMCYYLRKSKGTGLALNSRISALMQYTLSCGVFTSACSVTGLFTFILMPNNLVYLALTFLLTRLYINSFMAMMNARQRQRRGADGVMVSFPYHSASASGERAGVSVSVQRSHSVSATLSMDAESVRPILSPRPTDWLTDQRTPQQRAHTYAKFEWDEPASPAAVAAVPGPDRSSTPYPHAYLRQW